MTDPTHEDRPDPPPWRLTLDEGDRLELRPSAEGAAPEQQIVLTLPHWRAYDLSTVLHRYNRIAEIFAESSDNMTEESLARGLRDARAAAVGRPDTAAPAARVGEAERGWAMVSLQANRPELTHDKIVAIIDATAWWLDNREDYKAIDLLEVVAPEVSQLLYSTLLDWKPPAGPPQQSALGPTE